MEQSICHPHQIPFIRELSEIFHLPSPHLLSKTDGAKCFLLLVMFIWIITLMLFNPTLFSFPVKRMALLRSQGSWEYPICLSRYCLLETPTTIPLSKRPSMKNLEFRNIG